MSERTSRLLRNEPRLARLVELCKSDLQATEVWLFGSRARDDATPESDWDVLAVVADDAPADIDTPISAWKIRRRSGLHADLLTTRATDFVGARNVANTISYSVAREGVRLDV